MSDLIIQLDNEKTRLTEKLSDSYARSTINIEEYERLLDYINKIETKREVTVVENIIQSYNSTYVNEPSQIPEEPEEKEVSIFESGRNSDYAAIFSNRTVHLESVNGKGGNYASIFGSNKIIADKLPQGRTVIRVESIFGTTEIIVARNVRIKNKVDTIFSNADCPEDPNSADYNSPELLIKGKVIFGNLTVRRK